MTMNLILVYWNMIMDCVVRYKNIMLIVEMKFEELILKLIHTDLRSQTTTVPPSNIMGSSLGADHAFGWYINQLESDLNGFIVTDPKSTPADLHRSHQLETIEGKTCINTYIIV
jgi:hypothetical protein